jgi:SSS family solute:Na+ symporter
MMLGQTVGTIDIVVILLYLFLVVYLGWLGFRHTKTTADYLVAGRKTHPFIMALSYGATFISTSAIVGFGGVSGLFGMSLLWLTFLNIFVGIFIAFVMLGGPTRRIGHILDAHTFPELIGRRYESKGLQVFCGFIIFLFMPLYAAAVIIGGSEFITTAFNLDYGVALLIFSVVVAAYVVAGGLKGVMYTDALQGVIMFVGMLVLLVYCYVKVDGPVEGHRTLTEIADLTPGKIAAMGGQGWAATPKFGFGSGQYDLWWIVFSTIVLGVGIGVLAQPQLAVRFMTVKSKRELNRAVLIGGIFILMMTGVAFTVGSMSNAYFVKHGPLLTGVVAKTIDAGKGHVVIDVMKKDAEGKWAPDLDPKGAKKSAPVVLDKSVPAVDALAPDGKPLGLVQGRSIAVVYAKGNSDQIIPTYITSAMPKWFGLLFLLTLLAAAMSTLSSQFHTLGTALGRDVVATTTGQHEKSVPITRLAIVFGLIVAVVIAFYARGRYEYVIARATAIFFGLCASAFLPAFVGGLFFRRITKAAAFASMIVGFLVTTFWLLFVKSAEAQGFGLVQMVTGGKTSILADYPNWPVVDPLVVALPVSILTAILVSFFTKAPSEAHLNKCFGPINK